MNTLEHFVPLKGSMLDIGCGNGSFASYAALRGWQVTGIEPRPASAAAARAHGIAVHQSSINAMDFEEESFDAVVLWQVIEHLPHLECMQRVHRIAKPGAIVAVSTPNVKGIGSRMLHERWPGIEPHVHFHLFSPASLNMLMRKHGFIPVKQYCHDVLLASLRVLTGKRGSRERPKPRNLTAESMASSSVVRAKLLFTAHRLANLILGPLNAGENIYGYFRKQD
jgi:SAM-dependent methyltransferase